MKRIQTALMSSVVALCLLSTSSLVSADQPFSAQPRVPLQTYDMNRGALVQKFSGAFVKQLSEEWLSSAAQSCLRSYATAPMTFTTFANREVRAEASRSCGAHEHSEAAPGPSTGEITIPANRVLAMVLVSQRFSLDPRFSSNDQDLAHYDVEIYGMVNNQLKVLLQQAPRATRVILGCPKTGPIDTSYTVDLRTFAVTRGNMVC